MQGDVPKIVPQKKILSIAEYASELVRIGTRVVPGSPGTFWVGHELGAMVRIPTFHLTPPAAGEVQQVQREGSAAIVSYIVEPDQHYAANAWLYSCRDFVYSLDKLSKRARRDARRAQRSLLIAPIDWPSLLEHGFSAFSDTRIRVGLSDGTRTHFSSRFESFSHNPAHRVIGAWKESSLVAFMTLVVVDDWVEIEGSFSANAHQGLCPNDGLANYVLDYFLMQRAFRLISYGASSVQENTDNHGLHNYKKKIGFETQPVHRAFVLHPLLRPFANRLTQWGLKAALYFMPGERRLKKVAGALASLLGKGRE